ncbi:PstS family phosphate ABC transporter substrate-binding protein [Jeotgalibacillus proteolyticus]|uniref:PBP domain-containing protein n=1 Tax=Jeotgalibacillus proteolyticus TaxID=2082395 RepID=A0A2S5GCP9_9BACL|nr:substrate-binding domain-containing protein [Jeotgalibacillus proteolyticus]PPA70728.1 hypothetical protein C4B60_07995 [Jeotgalibacillus proteolyticus]
MIKKILGAVLVTAALSFFGYITVFISFLNSSKILSPEVLISFWGSIIIVLNLIIFGVFSSKTTLFKFGFFILLFSGALVSYHGVQFYQKSLEVADAAEVDLSVYKPFKWNTKAVSLEEKAALKLEGDLPVLDGATALYPLYSAFARAVYPEDDYDLYSSEVSSTKTDMAYERLMDGEVDIIFTAGPSERQEEIAKQKGLTLSMTPIGKEAFVFFVHAKNPVEELTVEEIQQIYSGKMTNWKEAGGRNDDILAFQRPQDSGSQTALQKLMHGIQIMEPPAEDVIGGMGEIINETSTYRNHKNAIGFSYRFFSTEMVQNGKIKLLNINGIPPNKENIRNGSYPFTSEFYAITAGTTNSNAERFIEWIKSAQGQELVEKTGYVPLD